jgi:hypothetical protein
MVEEADKRANVVFAMLVVELGGICPSSVSSGDSGHVGKLPYHLEWLVYAKSANSANSATS